MKLLYVLLALLLLGGIIFMITGKTEKVEGDGDGVTCGIEADVGTVTGCGVSGTGAGGSPGEVIEGGKGTCGMDRDKLRSCGEKVKKELKDAKDSVVEDMTEEVDTAL